MSRQEKTQRNGAPVKPMQSFLSDRHRNHSSLKCFISIIWQRHWERIGKILSSNCKHVLKVQGEYQRICLHEVFIQLYKTGAGWICQLSIKEDLDFGRSFHSTRQVARLYNYCQLVACHTHLWRGENFQSC